MENKHKFKRVFRFIFWISLFGFSGILLGSKSIEIEGNILLEYGLIGCGIGLIFATIFNLRSKK